MTKVVDKSVHIVRMDTDLQELPKLSLAHTLPHQKPVSLLAERNRKAENVAIGRGHACRRGDDACEHLDDEVIFTPRRRATEVRDLQGCEICEEGE